MSEREEVKVGDDWMRRRRNRFTAIMKERMKALYGYSASASLTCFEMEKAILLVNDLFRLPRKRK